MIEPPQRSFLLLSAQPIGSTVGLRADSIRYAIGLGVLGVERFDVTWWGKTGTFFLMFAYPFLLGGASDVATADVLRALGWICGIPGLVISWYAFGEYGRIGRRALSETMRPE